VVVALERLPVGALRLDGIRAVPADVHEPAQLPVECADDDDRDVRDAARDPVPGVAQPLERPGDVPRPGEDVVELELVDRRVRVPAGRERLPRGERCLDLERIGSEHGRRDGHRASLWPANAIDNGRYRTVPESSIVRAAHCAPRQRSRYMYSSLWSLISISVWVSLTPPI